MKYKFFLSFYEITVLIETDDVEAVSAANHNFSYFSSSAEKHSGNIKIYYHKQLPPYSSLPAMTSIAITPGNICYRELGKTYIDYFGKALCICDSKNNTFNLYTADSDLANEAICLIVISRVAELLNKKGMHRIHALGLEHKNKGILVLLPCGGGKTSLALSLLDTKDDNIKLISEDSPLIKNGNLYPFPLRIGVHPEDFAGNIPEKFLRKKEIRKYDDRITIDIEYFSKHIGRKPVPLGAILIGKRSTATSSEISPVSKLEALKYCLQNSVRGAGLLKCKEFTAQDNKNRIIRHFAILFSRTIANINMILKAKTFSFVIGGNELKTASTLKSFLNELS